MAFSWNVKSESDAVSSSEETYSFPRYGLAPEAREGRDNMHILYGSFDTSHGDQPSDITESSTGVEKVEKPDSKEAESNVANSKDNRDSVNSPRWALHAAGKCKPCKFFYKASLCYSGDSCRHCHYSHDFAQMPPRPGKYKRKECQRMLDVLDGVREADLDKYNEVCEHLSEKSAYFRLAWHNRESVRLKTTEGVRFAEGGSAGSRDVVDQPRNGMGELERTMQSLLSGTHIEQTTKCSL